MIFKLLRKFPVGLFPILLVVSDVQGASAANKDNTSGLLGTKLAFAQAHSDYFQFFNLEPVGDAQSSVDGQIASFKPTGSAFRQLVTVYVKTDAKQIITGVRLVIARSFVDDQKNGIFARDLIKSSLLASVNAIDAASLQDLATEILYRDVKRTILAGNEPHLSPTPSAAYLVVSAANPSWETKLQSSKIRFSNETEEDRKSLVIAIDAG
jgi:hypothetical protein